ncbi:MAG: PAS domain S-box protein, partial [Gammaproteobacteria bacterium]|nr:PAS domain S-box protein [Gammaproteobacteria bacterium]
MSPKRILLVEDELLIAQGEKQLLESLGYVVAGIARSGEEALRRVEEEIPDMVLMDIMLGGEMDGIEAADTIRKQHDIPVVFVTAYADEQFIERAKLTEPFGYVIKPIDSQSLASTVEVALYKHSVDRKLRESEEKYRLAMEATQDGLWDWNVMTGSVYYSPVWSRILGTDSILNNYSTWEDRIHPDDKYRILKALRSHLAGETKYWHEEHRLRNSDGNWNWVLGRGKVVKRDKSGNPLRMVGTMTEITERKLVEQELVSERQLSEEYINSLPGLFYVFDEQRFVRWNREFSRVTGYSDEELARRYGTDFFEGEDRHLIKEQMLKVFREGYAEAEVELVTKDGRRIPYYLTGLRKKIDGNEHLVGLGIDITERKRAEEELRKSEFFLRETQKIARVGGWKLNPEIDFLSWTEGVYDIIEAPLDYKPGLQEGLKYYLPEYIPVLQDRIQRCYTQGDPFLEECELTTDSGTRLWIEMRGVARIIEDKTAYVVGTFQDITGRKHAEEELRHLRNYLSNIINSMPSALVGVDLNGKVTQWNSEAQRATGLLSENAMGQPLSKAFPRLSKKEMDRIREAMQTRQVYSDLKVAHQQNGETYYEDVTVYPLIANGVVGAVIRVDDITERVRLEEMMVQSEKMISVGGLAAGMAHEINNPLAGMM